MALNMKQEEFLKSSNSPTMPAKKKGQYRFFYHYYKRFGKMSFHFKNEPCHVVDDVICLVPCETKWNKTQPNLVMRGWASGYKIENNTVTIF